MKNTNVSKSPLRWVAKNIKDLPRSGIRDFFELVMSMDDVISLGVGEPDFVTPWEIREATINSLELGRTSYTSNLGLLKLRQEICDYVVEHFGVSYNPNNECIITVGVSEALDLILRAILEPGDEVLYHDPCYVSYPALISMANAVPVPISTTEENSFKLDPAALESKITSKTKAVLLNFPNNPTGANLSKRERQDLIDVILNHDILVITDEIYAELTYGEPCKSIASYPEMKERCVFLHGFSKAYAMTGFRIGYACAPHDLVEAMMKIHQYSMLCASIVSQEAAIEALRSAKGSMNAMRDEYMMRRNLIVKRFNSLNLPCVMPDGAFYVFPNIGNTGLTGTEFAKRLLAEESVAVVPGTAFSGSADYNIRCSYAVNINEIEEALTRIERFVKRLRQR